MLDTAERLPWAGHSAHHALGEMYELIKRHKTALIFVNTRSQAESIFQELWRINDDGLAIALHHGSLDVAQRRKVEAAMADGRLRAVVATSSLDLGVDWGDVDLVINVGAPKGASRLLQRIGRANHRMDEPSKGVLIPANRFEVLECTAALGAIAVNAQDTPAARTGALDVLAQHVLGSACGEPFLADELYAEVRSAAPYAALARADFDAVLDFVATGGYALKAYERFAKIRQGKDGRWRVSNPMIAQRYRMNVGTIVEADMLKVRLVRSRVSKMIPRGGRLLGEVEEYFIEMLVPGDTFVFAGEILRYEAIVADEVYVSRASSDDPKVPSYEGGKFPLSTYLADRVRKIISDSREWRPLPSQVREWLEIQQWRSLVPGPRELLVETFPRADKHYLVCYPFEGRLAHQTLGMLLTRRLERARLRPLGFVANEYALAVWGLGDVALQIARGELSLAELFDEDMLGDDLEAWLAESALMKRTFRTCAIIAGLIERRFPGKEKSRREVTISTDLVYDVLRKHQADHILLRAARADAATGLLDIRRLGEMLSRIKGRIVHKALDHVSPLAVPVMLEIGRETVHGEASEDVAGGSRGGAGEGGDAVSGAMPSVRGVCRRRIGDRGRRRRARRRLRRRALLARGRAVGRRRPASGEGLELRRARRAAAALRYRGDAGADRASRDPLCAARGDRARRQLSRRRRPGAHCGDRPRGARCDPARARVDLDHRQSRPGSRRRHRRQLCRHARHRRADFSP